MAWVSALARARLSFQSARKRAGPRFPKSRLGSALIARAVVPRGSADHSSKLLGEMTLVGETELTRDLGQRFLRKHQCTATHAHTELADVIMRRTFVSGAKLPFERPHRKSTRLREIQIRDTVSVVLADVTDRDAHRGTRARSDFFFTERPG